MLTGCVRGVEARVSGGKESGGKESGGEREWR